MLDLAEREEKIVVKDAQQYLSQAQEAEHAGL
jgi:hypothetical protein